MALNALTDIVVLSFQFA